MMKSIMVIARQMKVLKHDSGDGCLSMVEILDVATDALSLACAAKLEINNRRRV